MSPDAAPRSLTAVKKLSLDGKQSKDKQWERRLLDLSLKNTLLHFQPEKMVLHVLSADPDSILKALAEKGEMTLAGGTLAVNEVARRKVFFGVSAEVASMRELIALEVSGGIMRTFSENVVLDETVSRLIKRSKEADEESGTKILYLALGFLRWYSREDGKENYAPLVLQPVTLKKGKGGVGYAIAPTDEDFSVNSTLLEFLKQEFNIDIRGLDGALQGLKISEILAMVRMEIVNMKDWEVFDDVYVAAFSFARYQMWQDLRRNMDEFSKNELISSLLHNRCEIKDTKDVEFREDDCPPTQTLMPLPADSSQWEAVALSQTGKTFVLHGPPGTGKSQTITNIIANALNDGKRVLFVAEKQAALSVVKKRLDWLGLGDFCLELHSNKTNKADVLQKLAATLAQFTARYDAHKEDKTAPYPGIAALIDALNTAGVQCAVFSNKADPLCGKIIEHYFGAGRFVLVRGSRPGVPTKPDPTGVYSLMQDLHADPASTLFVGDSDVDILTGHNAGLPAMGALWGFRGHAELTAAGADALASVPEDILEYVRTH